jgi:hypothetical protein
MDALLQGLRDESEDVRENTSDAIFFLVSEEFVSYDAARAWWDSNAHRFDGELFVPDDEDE